MQAEPDQYADFYQIHRLLGEGGQANVYLGTHNANAYALKVYQPGASKEAAYKIEADLLSKLKHPNLINMVSHAPQAKFKIDNHLEENRPLIVLDLAAGGQLFDYISKTGKFSPELSRTYVKQLINALAYLTNVGITHRDLKPQNILFDKNFTLKISDFGLARDAKGKNGNFKLTSRVGTPGYKAPEVETGNYEGLKGDIFAIGVILFIMYTGTPPFVSTKSHDRIYKLISEKRYAKFWELHEKNKPPGFYSEPFKRLINSFLSAEPDRRPTFESLDADEWLQGKCLTEEEVIAEMSTKAAKMGFKVFTNSEQLLKLCGEKGQNRGELDIEDQETTKQDVFTYHYIKANIDSKILPIGDKINVVYIKKDPKFLLGWINTFLFDQLKNGNTFLEDFVEEVKFIRYNVDIQENHNLKVQLEFQIEREDIIQLTLQGNIHKNNKGEQRIGIEWIKAEGNSFWLSAIKQQINLSLNSIN